MIENKKVNPNLSTSYSTYQPDLSKHDPKYKKLAENNPYANAEYRESWWQQILSGLGFRTNKDAYLESMALQAQEYDNALLQKEYDEQYNSPLEQAERERSAGLNPNLTGNVSSGEASPLRDDGNPPVPPQSDEFGQVIQFAGNVLSGVQGAFALAGEASKLVGQSLDNRSKKIANHMQEDNFMTEALLNVLPNTTKDSGEYNYNQLYDMLKKGYGSRIKKRYFSDFVNRANLFANGLTVSNKQLKLSLERASNRKSFYRTVSGSDYSEVDEVMTEVSRLLSDLALDADSYLKNASIKKSEADIAQSEKDKYYQDNVRPEELQNKLEYEQNLDPAKMAQNAMSMSDVELGLKRNEKEQSDFAKTLRSSYRKILHQLDNLEDNGNWFAPYAKMAISTIILKYLPGVVK